MSEPPEQKQDRPGPRTDSLRAHRIISVKQHAAGQAEGGAKRATRPGDLQIWRGSDERDQDSDAESKSQQQAMAWEGEVEELRCEGQLVGVVCEGAREWVHREVRSREVVTPRDVACEECRLVEGACTCDGYRKASLHRLKVQVIVLLALSVA